MITKSTARETDLLTIIERVYEPCSLELSNLILDKESQDYAACSFKINALVVVARSAKRTPKKIGQFVTVWKRIANGPIQPYSSTDGIDLFVINTRSDTNFGQFVFPKSELLKQGILTHGLKDGKRGIRVYPPWDKPTSKQAQKTQKWQLLYFLSIDLEKPIDLNRVKALYAKN